MSVLIDIFTEYSKSYKFFFNVYFHFWERDRAWVGEGQRERETQNLKQAPGSELSAQSPTQGSNSRTWDHDLSRSLTLNWLSHPGAPVILKTPGFSNCASFWPSAMVFHSLYPSIFYLLSLGLHDVFHEGSNQVLSIYILLYHVLVNIWVTNKRSL